MEKQNKRALKAFGRGITFFALHLATLSMRALFGLGFLDGFSGIAIGWATLAMIMHYGSDVAERFHVSRDRAVRGSFSYDESGVQRWSSSGQPERNGCCTKLCLKWCGKQWRPLGHDRFTPLWRLDKLIAFPWHDDGDDEPPRRGGGEPHEAPSPGGPRSAAAGHRQQVEQVLLQMQGTPLSTLSAGSGAAIDGGSRGSGASSSSAPLAGTMDGIHVRRASRDGPPQADFFDIIASRATDLLSGRSRAATNEGRAGQQSRLLRPAAPSSSSASATQGEPPPRRLSAAEAGTQGEASSACDDSTLASAV